MKRKRPRRIEPIGSDIERFLALGLRCAYGSPGCLLVNSLREVAVLPPAVETLIREYRRHLHLALARNLEAARPSGDAQELADLVLTFFSGLTLEQNLATDEKETQRKIASFMRLLRGQLGTTVEPLETKKPSGRRH